MGSLDASVGLISLPSVKVYVGGNAAQNPGHGACAAIVTFCVNELSHGPLAEVRRLGSMTTSMIDGYQGAAWWSPENVTTTPRRRPM